MKKLILYIASSLDGYIARKNGGIDWLFTDNDYGYNTFIAGIDTVLMGYKTYEAVLSFGDYEYKDKKSYIFTRKEIASFNNITFVNKNIPEFVRNLKTENGKDIWLIGGGEIVSLLMKDNLIDEYMIFVHPLLLGEGIPLFPEGFSQVNLQSVSTKKYPSGLIQLNFTRKD